MSQAPLVTRPAAAPRAAATRPASPRLGLALLVIATAQLMVVLDATIVNVALPHIQRTLGFSGSGLEWVVNAYALAFGGLMLLGGRAGDLLGRRLRHLPGLAARGPGDPGCRRCAGRPRGAVADHHHVRRRQTA